MKRLIARFLAAQFVIVGLSLYAQVEVLTYHNDNNRLGQNLNETILTPASVAPASFGKLFSYNVDGYVYAQPLYVSGLSIPGAGKHNVVFVATEHNSVYAFDADTNAAPLWQVNLGPSGLSASGDFGTHYGSYTDITPEVGITGTPVIDLGSKTLYVDAFTHEGTNYVHKIHALDITTGAEQSFSPIVVNVSVPGTGLDSNTNGMMDFNARQELQRAALTLANGILYAAYAGYADTDPFHGWIIGFNASNLQQLPGYVFNTTPNSATGQGGIWMSGCGLSVDAGGNLYCGVGNGSFNAFNNSGGTEYGDTFLKLSTAGSLSVDDYFTPYNQQYLSANNLDIGSSGILLLPNQPGSFPHLMFGAGKSGIGYLMNRDMLTATNNHYNTNGSFDAVVQTIAFGGPAFGTPAYLNGSIYFAPVRDVLRAYTLTNEMLPDAPTAMGPRTYGYPGATPSVSANGANDGIVWAVQYGNPAVLIASPATNVATEIYSSDATAGRDDLPASVKFAVPTIANGKVYVGGQYALTVFGLLDTGGGTNTGGGGGDWQPVAGNYNGLFYESGGVQLGTSGFFSANTTTKGTLTGKIQMSTGRYSFRGQFDSSGAATLSVPRKGNSTLTMNLQMNTLDNSRIGGTVGDGTWTADLNAYRSDSTSSAGRYTLVLPSSDGSTGDGYGTATLSPAGRVKFTGALPNGTKLSQSAAVSADGQWPFYAPLKSGAQILGWLVFTNASIGGELNWNSAPVDVIGSPYQPGTGPVNFTDGVVTLSGGGLNSDLSSDVSVLGSRATGQGGNSVKLTISPGTGLFKGSMANPSGGKPLNFSGAVLQNQDNGSGYFLNAGQSGRVSFGPQP